MCVTYRSDLFTQNLGLLSHAVVVTCSPEGPPERLGSDTLDLEANTKVLDSRAKEPLISKKRMDDCGDACPQTGACGACSAVMDCSINLSE